MLGVEEASPNIYLAINPHCATRNFLLCPAALCTSRTANGKELAIIQFTNIDCKMFVAKKMKTSSKCYEKKRQKTDKIYLHAKTGLLEMWTSRQTQLKRRMFQKCTL